MAFHKVEKGKEKRRTIVAASLFLRKTLEPHENTGNWKNNSFDSAHAGYYTLVKKRWIYNGITQGDRRR